MLGIRAGCAGRPISGLCSALFSASGSKRNELTLATGLRWRADRSGLRLNPSVVWRTLRTRNA